MRRNIAPLLICLSTTVLMTVCNKSEGASSSKLRIEPIHKVVQTVPREVNVAGKIKVMIESARSRVHLNEKYDPSYFRISYPGGDVPNDRGVCTDVVIRAYREIGIDLQVLVHEDMLRNFHSYPKIWGLKRPDTNIDHRRVPNLQTFLNRQSASLPVSQINEDYQPGDLVTWMLPGNLPHIGIVSNRTAQYSTRPLILHNIGNGTSEEDILFTYKITGHYRYIPLGT